VLILVMLFTWSPKFKDLVAVYTDKFKKMLCRKEAGTK
jgi:hypothetical protein